jgi:hypothetical protein
METNCKDCNRLIDECTCLQETIDFPKYTRDQKRRAVQEIVRRLNEFDGALKLIRQFDICEQDILEYTAARYVNSSKYTYDPALGYDTHPRQPINAWPERNLSTFDQAVEEATELRTRAMAAALSRYEQGSSSVKSSKDWVTIEELEARTNQAALTRTLQGLVTTPSPSLKSYTDWA